MTMPYSDSQRRLYLDFLDGLGQRWLEIFEGNTEFYSAPYWDLLKEVWSHAAPVRKTDALSFMTGIKSPHTAGKYIDAAIEYGFLVETENPADARSKLISLSPAMRAKLDAYFDDAVAALCRSAKDIESED